MIVAAIASIVGVFLAVTLWLLNPEPLRAKILAFLSFQRQLDVRFLADLEAKGLTIKNRELLQSPRTARLYRNIFWPVVPPISPNLIHGAFIRYLVPLCEGGLRVTLFVFDEYAAIVRGRPTSVAKSDANLFVNALKTMGLSRCNLRVVYQSDIASVSRRAVRVLPAVFRCLGTLGRADLDRMSATKPYMSEDVKAIRYLKPILNMVYMLTVKGRYGFVLSGMDEEPLWSAFKEIVMREHVGVAPVCLYIPIMKGVSAGGTHGLDETTNVVATDNIEDIKKKVYKGLECLEKGNALSYFLENIFYSMGNVVRMKDGEGWAESSSISDLLARLKARNSDCEGAVVSITNGIKALFSGSLMSQN